MTYFLVCKLARIINMDIYYRLGREATYCLAGAPDSFLIIVLHILPLSQHYKTLHLSGLEYSKISITSESRSVNQSRNQLSD